LRSMLASADNRFSRPARELYDLLLKPAQSQLQDKNRLVIVPDGSLWELPMQALQTSQGRYLIDDHAIFYAPSLTVLREMTKTRDRIGKPSAAPALLALGNPALGKETVARVKAVLMDAKLEPLPEAEQQVKALESIYGSDNSTVYVGAEAREDRFKSDAGEFGILHLATHGVLNDHSPMYSHLLLAQTGKTGKEDGLLEARELMQLDLKADLAVLSACETARGRVRKGEGMIGLTWALFVAGVPTTVVSQWKVRSDSTAELMVEFHRQLKAGLDGKSARVSVAEALRQAALKLKRDKKYRHPFHWAGFGVVGAGY
ncbi:MAG: CHAT domain-containing protein, partial [Bryobacteraceae bacterium]